MPDEEAEDLLQEVQTNAEGKVDYLAFVKGLFQSL